MDTNFKFIGIDQNNQIIWIKKFPRKELMSYFQTKSVHKIFIDNKEGKSFHIGYSVRNHWYQIFKIIPFKGE